MTYDSFHAVSTHIGGRKANLAASVTLPQNEDEDNKFNISLIFVTFDRQLDLRHRGIVCGCS